jgi:hypothetical protein
MAEIRNRSIFGLTLAAETVIPLNSAIKTAVGRSIFYGI